MTLRTLLFTMFLISSHLHAQISSNGDVPVTILQTTDLHDHANGTDHVGLDVNPTTGMSATGAYARISAYVNSVRASAGHPVVLVDSGDWTMGTLYDLTLSTQPLALAFLNQMAYDCVTLGNHEFDYAPAGLAQMFKAAQGSFGFHTPIVASNLNLNGSTDLTPYVGDGKLVQTTRVQTLSNGLKVGYIGLMGVAAAQTAPVTAPVTFSDFSANYAAIQTLVDGLRNTQGVQVVIALSHSGTDATGTSGEDVELAKHVKGIDVIASGHTHTPLASAHSITNSGWTTQIIDAGAFGSNVSRIDLTYHSTTNTTSLGASSNPPMTDASLSAASAGLAPDATVAGLVHTADLQLNVALGAYLKTVFSDYDSTNLAKGIYHPVGTAAQDLASNEQDAVPAPNGLADLAADAARNIPNAIVSQTLASVGGNPASLSSYDFTPYQVGVVATGVLRAKIQTGVPLTFADIYNVEPLGATPDTTQALPVAYPLISGYLEVADLKKLCALQLLAQSTLAPQDYYLSFSGVRYSLKAAESYSYFKYATAASVLQTISQSASSGSVPALVTLLGLASLPVDGGAALMKAYAADNSFAGALVKLNDANPTITQIGVNLLVVGRVATAAFAGTSAVTTLIVNQAVAAIDTAAAFAPGDGANTGVVTDLTGSARVRVATDLFAVLALNAVQSQFGVTVTVYKGATGSDALSGSDLNGILGNRINANPASHAVQELKAWMALLTYLETGLKGTIGSAYASTGTFTQFPTFGAAVQTRNGSYPLAAIAQLTGTLASVQGKVACASLAAPTIAAITNDAYGASVSASGTMIVWGSGFSSAGGNSVHLTSSGSSAPVTLDITTGSYFWDLSANQINATLAGRINPGQWTVTVKNACGVTSAGFVVTVQ